MMHTYIAESGVKTFPIIVLPVEKIIDTNGAGDAFVGGCAYKYNIIQCQIKILSIF